MLNHYFPDFYQNIEEKLTDPRRKKSCEYHLSELIMSSIMMYMLRLGSRNSVNCERDTQEFRDNYSKLMGLSLPHMDTVDSTLEAIDPKQLQQLQQHLVRILFKKRVFHKFRLLNKYFIVAIDGTGVFKFDDEPYAGCPYKDSKTGKRTYSQSVVEAKLICPNGFSISLCQEWIVNEDGKTKQDCEYKATVRLMKNLHELYPRLPICIAMDGLFLKHPIQKQIIDNDWHFIMVWKDKTQYGLQDEIQKRKQTGQVIYKYRTQVHNSNSRSEYEYQYCETPLDHKGINVYYVTGYKTDHNLNRDQEPQQTKFHFMTSLPTNNKTYLQIFEGGRLRWKIENEGFNAQKRQGYELHHKMNRNNFNAIQNYYICLQIAHLFSQLLTLAKNSISKSFESIKHMWLTFCSLLRIMTDYHPPPMLKKYNLRY